MFLKLNHQKLDIYNFSKAFVFECYKLRKHQPESVHLYIAEGASRKSEMERKRFFLISRNSIVEINAAMDIANGLGYLKIMKPSIWEKLR